MSCPLPDTAGGALLVVNKCLHFHLICQRSKAQAVDYLFHYFKFSQILCFKTSLYSYPPQTPTKLLQFYKHIVKAHLHGKSPSQSWTFCFGTTTPSLTVRWENLPYFSVYPAQVGYSGQAGYNVRNAKDFSHTVHTVSSIWLESI